MNHGSYVTAWVLLGIIVAVGIYDLALSQYTTGVETVSSQMYRIATRYPIVTLVIGMVLGHLFWPQRSNGNGH